MDLPTYRDLRQQAQRLTLTTDEAEDLVQDTLLAALQAGRSDAPWLAGTLRRQAALQVRTSVRRRRRERVAALASELDERAAPPANGALTLQLLKQLTPAARRLATLALHGLNADEVRWILGVSEAAFRQRLSSIRKRLAQLPGVDCDALVMPSARAGEAANALQFGLIRRVLKAALQGADGLGTHDGDGHLIVLRQRL